MMQARIDGLVSGSRCRRVLRAVACALLLALGAAAAARADGYLLGPSDRLRVKVYQWSPSPGEVSQFGALNDEFAVGADGFLALPFVGRLEVEGRQATDVAGAIAERLFSTLGMTAPPDVTVEVVRYRPFYVLGTVMQPGEYDFRPGLNVIQAVSLAGGYASLGGTTDPSGAMRDIISQNGQVALLRLDEAALLARKARLQAEQSESASLELPAGLADAARPGAPIVSQEKMIFDARRHATETQVEALNTLKQYLSAEIDSLNAQLGLLDDQFESVQAELASLDQIAQQSLATNSRRTVLDRTLLELRSDRLSTETALLRARQELSRADLSILERSSDRSLDVSLELRETEAQLEETRQKMAAAGQLLALSGATAADLAEEEAAGAVAGYRYTIMRPDAGALEAIAASEASPLEPGDTLRVEILAPAPQPPAAGN
jgi:protein involved in polysaccharide export with SLBB domain